MKPYKIMNSSEPRKKRTILVNGAKPPRKIPFKLFTKVHTPKFDVEFVQEDTKSHQS